MNRAKRVLAVFAIAGLLPFITPIAPAQPPATQPPAKAEPAKPLADHAVWYTISMAGQHAGYQRDTRTAADGKITSEQEASLVVRRGSQTIKNQVESTFVETADHKPLSMTLRREIGAEPVTESFTFREKDVLVKSTQGSGAKARTTERTDPLPEGKWLTPAAAEAFILQRQAAGAKEFSLRTIDPSSGLSVSTDTYTLQEKSQITVKGASIPSWKYSLASSKLQNIKQTVWLDEKATILRVEMDVAGVRMTTQCATREEAMKQATGAEIMVATFVKPDKAIRNARAIASSRFVLKATVGDLPDLPSAAGQTFKRIDKGSAMISVSTAAGNTASETEITDASGTSSNINKDDPEIIALTKRATERLPADADDAQKTEAIRAFVHTYITDKNLASGFATASEVARTKSGDCTEHAVLTAALLRAAGIPARVASGLVYADLFSGERDVFAYHMWTQAAISTGKAGRVWTDTDATLDRRFDATHIALAITPLKDGEFEASMLGIVRVLGQLSIKIDETSTTPAPSTPSAPSQPAK